ncbi:MULTISPECIES: hypothetical protein [Halolamina]|uniref:Uncharacterized protein n=1 Tax=Halolamina pelagica TaxID=699431 RepID=A0A1I5MWY5_9EURY|nr:MULTISPECIES: hypothetical protein [Halolamina]NHX36197.1 hypothetical protein [Halolamina sp. R1-12]SFP13992.1 hypothetical protein SAMN05216277_101443 [Halolamina pelagica]
MTDNGGNDRRRDIEGRINTLGTGNGVSGSESGRRSDDADESEGIVAGASVTEEADDEPETAENRGNGAADDADGDDETQAATTEHDGDAAEERDDDGSFETREEDADERSALEIEMDQFVRAFAARRAHQLGEDSLDEYIVGSVKGYLAGLLGGDVESPGTLKRRVEVDADEIFGGLLDTVAEDDQDQGDVVVEAIAEAYDVPEADTLVVAGLRDHEALLNGVVANNSNSLGDVSEVVQAAVETRLIEERAD